MSTTDAPPIDWYGRLDEFRTLPPNWDSYGARPITEQAIQTARELLDAITAPPLHVAPQANGGVLMEWQRGYLAIEVDIEPDGRHGYLRVNTTPPGTSMREADDVPRERILALVRAVVGEAQHVALLLG